MKNVSCLAVLVLLSALGWPSVPREVSAGDEASGPRPVSIPTTRGVALEGVLHVPERPSGTIVVIGSGRGYHMGLPLLRRTAEELARVGVAALRFDWAYHTAKGEHSPDLSVELQDLESAIAFARGVTGVRHVVLAGKSLGSVAVALRAQTRSDDVAGLMLLTWPIHAPGKPDEIQDGVGALLAWEKPLLIACGDADPYSELGALYEVAGRFERPPPLVLAPGDHGLHGPGGMGDIAATTANVDLLAHGIARWARIWAEGFPAPR